MAVKTVLDFKTVQGNSIGIKFSATDENGVPLILTGKTILWSLRNSLTLETVLEKSTLDDITILDAPNDHQFLVKLSSADTADLIGDHDHEAVIVDGDDRNSVTNADDTFGIITFREKV